MTRQWAFADIHDKPFGLLSSVNKAALLFYRYGRVLSRAFSLRGLKKQQIRGNYSRDF
jgi:hypothetical protein